MLIQAMLDTMYKQEYLRVRVVENQVILKNLPPSSSLINEIMEHVKGFLASKSLLKGNLQHLTPPDTYEEKEFVLSGIVACVDGRLCRNIPNPLTRRIVSGFLLSFVDQNDDETK